MSPPPRKKAHLLKLFLLDAQGGYAGEYVLDEDCVVEYGDFLAAIPKSGLGDGQSVFIGEFRATAMQGERVSLVAISRGSLGLEEVTWAKAALLAAESELVRRFSPEGPDKGVMESLAHALDEREARLREREAALQEMEARTRTAVEEYRTEMEAQVADLKARLEEAEAQRERDVKALAAERDRLHKELETIARAPRAPPADLDAERRRQEQDRKFLQKRAFELLDREEAVRDRELKVEEEGDRLAKVREELEATRAQIEAEKTAPPAFDVEAARKEIEMRAKILGQKALDLLAREEKLRKQTEKLQELLG